MQYDLSTLELMQEFKENYPTDWEAFSLACTIAEQVADSLPFGDKVDPSVYKGNVDAMLKHLLEDNAAFILHMHMHAAIKKNEQQNLGLYSKAEKKLSDLYKTIVSEISDLDIPGDEMQSLLEACGVPDYLMPKKEIEIVVRLSAEIPSFVDVNSYKYNESSLLSDYDIDLYEGYIEINE